MPDEAPSTLKVSEPAHGDGAPRAQVVRDFVVAVQSKDLHRLEEWLTDDIQWDIVGFKQLHGLPEVLGWVRGARETIEISFNSILTNGLEGSADGTVTNVRNITVAFSHILSFAGTAPSAKIKAVRSYLVSSPVAAADLVSEPTPN